MLALLKENQALKKENRSLKKESQSLRSWSQLLQNRLEGLEKHIIGSSEDPESTAEWAEDQPAELTEVPQTPHIIWMNLADISML